MDFLKNYKLEGQKLKIVKYPDPILKKKSVPVTEFNGNLKSLIKDLLFTMYKAPGIGLAAPQVGVSQRIFVMDIDYNREKITNAQGIERMELSDFNPRVFINPVLTDQQGEFLYEEGCLSLPGIFENVKRFQSIKVSYQDLDGNPKSIEAEGLFSVCLQHENDHLEGVVFLERLSLIKKNLLKKKFLKSQARA